MAKALMGRSRFKIQRSLGLELPGLGKPGALERRPYGPGQHGASRKKISDYGVRLKEKQKVVFHYGLTEAQLVRYIKGAKSRSTTLGLPWIDLLLINLECRIDNVIFRLNWAPSIAAARQMVSHKQVLVNGKPVNVANYMIEKGDVVTLTAKGFKTQNYLQAQAHPRIPTIPACFTVNKSGENFTATLTALPLATDIPFAFETNLFIEYYWKLK